MALSNMLKEPRREITESIIGLGVVALFLTGDYYFAQWFNWATASLGSDGHLYGCPWPLGMVFGVFAVLFAFLLVVGTHALGESICNALERQGVNLRPLRASPAPARMVDLQESLERQARVQRAYAEAQDAYMQQHAPPYQ